MKILFTINANHPEPLEYVNHGELSAEDGAELIIRLSHAMQYLSMCLSDTDAESIHEVTGTTITVFAPGLEPRHEDMPSSLGPVIATITLAFDDPTLEYLTVRVLSGSASYEVWM